MENFSTFLMIYLMAFNQEIRDLPRVAGYYFYAGLALLMAVLAAVNGMAVQHLLPWQVVIQPEAAKDNVMLALAFAVFAAVSARYMKQKILVEEYEENGYVVEPQQLGGMTRLLWLHELLHTLWVTLIAVFVLLKVIPDLQSAEWTVAFGTVEFFVFAWIFCRLQNLLFDKDPEMGPLTKSYLLELQSRDALTDEEQELLKKKFTIVGII